MNFTARLQDTDNPMARTYRDAALENASGVELVVALYDGLIRFLVDAAEASERGDVAGRRDAARRSLDILIHLQATLRPDVGGRPAEVLAEFYAAIFANILTASQAAAPGEFHHAARCVRTVREAWYQVSIDPAVAPMMSRDLQTQSEKQRSRSRPVRPPAVSSDSGKEAASGWIA